MSTYRARVRVWIIGGTSKAYRVSDKPKGADKGRSIWLPKSQVIVVERSCVNVPGLWVKARLSLPRWLVLRAKLRDSVIPNSEPI